MGFFSNYFQLSEHLQAGEHGLSIDTETLRRPVHTLRDGCIDIEDCRAEEGLDDPFWEE